MDTNNIYLFKALDAYPYNLEEAIEALNYALSYNDKDTEALLLMGKIYGYHLQNYKRAIAYFSEALTIDLENPKIYPDYLYMLIYNEDFSEAQKLLDFAFTIKATNKGMLYNIKGYLYEAQKQYKKAFKAFKEAEKIACNNDFATYIKGEKQRVKNKMLKKKNKKKKKNHKRKEKKKNRSKK